MTEHTSNAPSAAYLMGWGILRCSLIFPFEHPLELLKNEAQKSPKISSWAVAKGIKKEGGWKGFTHTALANFPRRLAKETLRWPAVGLTHGTLVHHFPTVFTKEGINTKFATGLSVAAFDSLFILPFDQLISFCIKEKEGYVDFFKKRFTKYGVRSLYNGCTANFIRQSMMWGTVLPLNTAVKKYFDTFDKEKAHPHLKQAVTSVVIASSIVGWILPLDFVKTRIQMDTSLHKRKLSFVVPSLLRQYRFTHFYAGALPVFIHTIFHVTVSGCILDKLFLASSK